MAPRRRCPVCKSKQWHKEPSSGLIACSEGHVLQNYRNEATEAEEMGPHALRKRTLKSGRKKKERESTADPKLYHGARGRYHFFECQQIILRKQVAALTELWELPKEFEIICRDVWALHLSLLPDPPSAEPYFHARGEGNLDEDVKGKEKAKATTPENNGRPNTRNAEMRKENDGAGSQSSSSSSSEDEDERDGEGKLPERDPELEELLRANSEIPSSSSSSEEDDAAKLPIPKKRPSRNRGRYKREGPASTLVVLVLGCWILRIPVLYRDLRRLIESYQLPYLDPIKVLPPNMVVHLTKHNKQAMTPYHAPSTLTIHTHVSRLAKRLYASYGIFIPEANAGPILWRAVKCLGGTPTLYSLTKRLAHVLSLPLTLHHTLAPGLPQLKRRDPEIHKYDNAPPELALVATAVIVLKMVYGLDGKMRLPRHPDDPACALPRIDEYMSLLKEMDMEGSSTSTGHRRKDEDMFQFDSWTPLSVGDMSEGTLDEYLDFCQDALLGVGSVDDENTGWNLLSNYFPLALAGGRRNEERGSSTDEGKEIRRQLGAAVPVMEEVDTEGVETPLRPAQSYAIYNSRDVLGELPEEYGVVVKRASRWVGVDMEYFLEVSENLERRVMRWWRREKKRRSRGISEMCLEEDMSDGELED